MPHTRAHTQTNFEKREQLTIGNENNIYAVTSAPENAGYYSV